MNENSPRLAVVLINYYNEEDTTDCLESLSRQTLNDFTTIVVDNGSNLGSFESIMDRFEFPTYIQNNENLGFTGGNNSGIKRALERGIDWILLLNNDTEVEPEFLEKFLASVKNLPESTGVAGPKIHAYSSKDVWAAGGTINHWTGNTNHRLNEDQMDQSMQVDYVVGAALLVRSEVFKDIGLLDEDFFLYYEETEFCQRAIQSGWEVWYVPVSGVYHKETVDYSYNALREYYLTRNRFLFIQKSQPVYRRLPFYPYFIIRWVLLQTLYMIVVNQDIGAATATLRGGVHAILGKSGRANS